MARSRFVAPNTVRLAFVDVHRRLHQNILEQLEQAKRDGKDEVAKQLEVDLDHEAKLRTQAEKDGDWIEVKKELNTGEQRRLFTKLVKSMRQGEAAELDPEMVGKTRLLEYIVAWSFVGPDGKPVPFSSSALDSLDTDTYVYDVIAAVDLHIEDVEKAREIRKNGLSTSPASVAISV